MREAMHKTMKHTAVNFALRRRFSHTLVLLKGTASQAAEKLPFLPFGGSRGLQPHESGQSNQGALAAGSLLEVSKQPFSATSSAVPQHTLAARGALAPEVNLAEARHGW